MPRSSLQAILLVDGYNVIGSGSFLEKTKNRDGLDAARQALIEALVNYSAFEGYRTQVVFDAHSQNTPLSCEASTEYVSVLYTSFGQTADTYIEKFCASHRSSLTYPKTRLIVATSDRAQQQTVIGYGAQWMSSQQLCQEIEMIRRRVSRKYRPQKHSRSRFLFNSLDANSQQRLAQWRKGIR